MDPTIFHAYDIRGVYPDQFDEAGAKRIAGAYAQYLKPKTVAIGRDVRLSSPKIHQAVIDGLTELGVDVIDIGPVPTDMLYFAVAFYGFDGGIQVTASHNPAEFNGLKMVKAGAEVIIAETGLEEIKQMALSGDEVTSTVRGQVQTKDVLADYLTYIAKFADFDVAKKLKIVANNNFGLTGSVAKALLQHLGATNIEIIELNFEPDGSFPKGRPDPLVTENQAETSALIRSQQADFGVAWDADGDRCFFVDENGQFINGSSVAAIFATELLTKHPGEKILYDIRNAWTVAETIQAAGGVPLAEKVGHGFFKNRMRREQALFGGELSGHYYFRDFFSLDNGLIPFILFLNLVTKKAVPVADIFKPLTEKYFVSGEINFKISDKAAATQAIEAHYSDGQIDTFDGLSVSYPSWRFNLRASNNENLLRLNVEARDQKTCLSQTNELTQLITTFTQV